MPWPLSEAAPALFFSLTSLSKKVLYFLASRSPPEVLQAPLLFNFQSTCPDLIGKIPAMSGRHPSVLRVGFNFASSYSLILGFQLL